MARAYAVYDIAMYRFHIKVQVKELLSGQRRGIFLSLFDRPAGSVLRLCDLADNLRDAADWIEQIDTLPMDRWGVGIGRLVKDRTEEDEDESA